MGRKPSLVLLNTLLLSWPRRTTLLSYIPGKSVLFFPLLILFQDTDLLFSIIYERSHCFFLSFKVEMNIIKKRDFPPFSLGNLDHIVWKTCHYPHLPLHQLCVELYKHHRDSRNKCHKACVRHRALTLCSFYFQEGL